MTERRKLLWVGDAGCSTGFARATHKTLDVLKETWDVQVVGINYYGHPHVRHEFDYDIHPAFDPINGSKDRLGVPTVARVVQTWAPDVVVVQNDPWNIPDYIRAVERTAVKCPVVAAVAVDGLNCRGAGLNGLALAIFWTRFGEQQAKLGGYSGPSAVVPLGVDLDIYKPQDRVMARVAAQYPRKAVNIETAFVVGNVNRNQPRKRLDLTLAYFAEWVYTRNVANAYLYMHVAPTDDRGWDLSQLARYNQIGGRFLHVQAHLGTGVDETELAMEYAAFDALITTTQGEGWSLPTMEAMACGVPCIVPDWAALGEWTEDAVLKVPCTTTAATPDGINVIGGVPDRALFITALDRLYRDRVLRSEMSARGLALVSRPEYRWRAIGEAFRDALEQALYRDRTVIFGETPVNTDDIPVLPMETEAAV